MTKHIAFRFWYFGELYILLHLCGITHASWWWVAFFYLIDLQEGLGSWLVDRKHKKEETI